MTKVLQILILKADQDLIVLSHGAEVGVVHPWARTNVTAPHQGNTEKKNILLTVMFRKRNMLTRETRDVRIQGAGVVLLALLQSIAGLPIKSITENGIIMLITTLPKNNTKNTGLTGLPHMRDMKNTKDNIERLRQAECDFKRLYLLISSTEMVQESRCLQMFTLMPFPVFTPPLPPTPHLLPSFELGFG